MKEQRITPYNITELKPGEVFVFGSNLAGRHGKGAALTARKLFGAIEGQSSGPMGDCFAIPTKDSTLRTLPLGKIGESMSLFLGYALARKESHFLVTPIGCGLAGYSAEEIAPLFLLTKYVNKPAHIPQNISLPRSFWQVLDAIK